MSNRVTKLHGGIHLDGEVDPNIVAALEEFLALAKAGKLRNVAIAAIDDELCAKTVYSHGGRSVLTLCGTIGLLLRETERSLDE